MSPTNRNKSGSGFIVILAAIFLILIVYAVFFKSSGSTASKNKSGVTTVISGNQSGTSSTAVSTGTSGLPFANPAGNTVTAGPNLKAGSDPSVLPSDVLIADDSGNQILIVTPAGKIVWQLTLTEPDDAFFTENGQDIMVTQEDHQMISLVNIATKKFIWRYGTPETPGSGPNQVDNPDDAMLLPNNYVVFGDIKNCSVVFLKVGSQVPYKRIGLLDTNCYHNPPYRFGSPNGAFPLTDGNFLITEINGDWVDEMTPSGHILWSVHPPGIVYPSDTNEVSPGVYLTVDYSTAGQLIKFNQQGQLLWKYTPTTANGQLNHPSLCESIPTNGYILCNDDYDDRVIVINPNTNTIVWQYGHKGVVGTTPGYLNEPDGVDLAPPYSMLIRNASTIGTASSSCWAANVCTYGINATSSGQSTVVGTNPPPGG